MSPLTLWVPEPSCLRNKPDSLGLNCTRCGQPLQEQSLAAGTPLSSCWREGMVEGKVSTLSFSPGAVFGGQVQKIIPKVSLFCCDFFQPSKVRAPSTLIPPSPSPEPLTTGSGRGRSMVRGRFSALKKGLVHSGWGIGTKSGLQPGTHSGFLSLVSPDQPEPHSSSGSQGGVETFMEFPGNVAPV